MSLAPDPRESAQLVRALWVAGCLSLAAAAAMAAIWGIQQ